MAATAPASVTPSHISGCQWRLLPPRQTTAFVPSTSVCVSSHRRLFLSICNATAKEGSRYSGNPVRSPEWKKKIARGEKSVTVKPNETESPREGKEEEIEVEEEIPWIQEKALDLVEYTGSVIQAIPGPRIARSSFPWVLAVPLAYTGVTFFIALVKTFKKFSSPREKRRKLVNTNAMLCESIDAIFDKGDHLSESTVKQLELKTGFSSEEIMRKYVRYALNEKPFKPELVDNLIHLKKASTLDDSKVAEVLHEISRRIVLDKGPVVMDTSGYSEKGFKRKLAVQTLFGKLFYLSELPEFCGKDNSLILKEIFGVADEDAEKLRAHTTAESGDVGSLQKMADQPDSEPSNS